MIAPLSIHPPKNWQDFETLCLKLWGEIWEIPHEIEFNSDNGQGQQGVDIYGPVNNGLKYNGIQCKNKKLNLIDGKPNRLTISDIQYEIDKAVDFKPSISKLVLATSLPKDQKVEEYVRIKSLEHANKQLFTIQICFWEFFERKIPEFQKIYDWYLKNENYYRPSGVGVSFKGGGVIREENPKFRKVITTFTRSSEPKVMNEISKSRILSQPFFFSALDNYRDWEQYCWFQLVINNTGKKVIEDYKIELEFEGEFQEVGAQTASIFNLDTFKSDVVGYSNCNRSLLIQPYAPILVPSDGFTTASMYIKPKIGLESVIKIKWKLLSRDYEDTGELSISVVPKYTIEKKVEFIEYDLPEEESTRIELIKRKTSYDPFQDFIDDISDMTFE